jgi:S-(hydroxymethyl)glutathione dehydrogenase/alcohol dehydrogenase
MARAFGARQVIAVDVTPEKLATARELGATDVVDASAADPVAAVRELTGGGVDVAFEALGRPQTVEQAFRMARDGGTVVAVGIGAGAAAVEIEITHMVRREIRLIGSYGARTRTDMPRVVELAATGAIDLDRLISQRVGLEDAQRIYGALDRGEVRGRALVTP